MGDRMADKLHEAFLRLFTRCEPELRAFVRSCLPRPQDVDEVMQEVSLVAWRKFGDLDDRGRFAPWACLIARYEILKYRRAHARNRLLLDESVIEAIADEAAAEMPLHQRRLEALEACFEKLAPARRELVLTAYTAGTSQKDLARQLGRTEGALYQLLSRIRQELWRCVELTLAKEAGAS
jgi:RNA polymerase sigma-70 factor (ECF subfamily)